MGLTVVGFLVLTLLFVRRHLRAAAVGRAATPRACPRCGTLVGSDLPRCPGCGVPMQVFEIVNAAVSDAEPDAGALHALVRADVCVGCGTCVDACPEPGALALRGKLATVDRERCVGHGHCAEACPVGAIVLSSGAAVHRVCVPEVSPAFETNVPGVYVVGELGGRGLIKNAVNEGKLAAEHVASLLPGLREEGDAEAYDLIIVGSGPAGLSAALEAHRQELRYLVLEQGTLADTVRKYPRRKLLLAEPVRVPLYGDLWVADASKEDLLQIWETVVHSTGLHLKTGKRVEQIARSGDVFRLVAGEAEWRARRVILALGRRGTPRRLGVPGEDLGKVVYDVAEMEVFAGRRVLVVGGGDSAVESALGLANQAGATVHLSYRRAEFSRIKERNRAKLDAAVAAGRVQVLIPSEVREIRPDRVVLVADGEPTILPNDDVIVRIGGDAPYRMLEELGVRIIWKDVPLADEQARAG